MIIQDSHIVLIGATGGIGQATALELARRGARLTLVSRHFDALLELKSTLNKPLMHDLIAVDITTKEGLTRLADHMRAHGKADALINNAGGNHFSMLNYKHVEEVHHDIQLNLVAPMLISQAALGLAESARGDSQYWLDVWFYWLPRLHLLLCGKSRLASFYGSFRP